MSEEKKFSLEEIDELLDKEESSFNFRELYTMLILNWQWFLLSIAACVLVAMLYLRYASPVFQVSSKMLIKDDGNRRRGAQDMLANMQDFGFISNSAGIENEVEILQSRILAQDAVKSLKLYATYMLEGTIKDDLIYKDQPVNVEGFHQFVQGKQFLFRTGVPSEQGQEIDHGFGEVTLFAVA